MNELDWCAAHRPPITVNRLQDLLRSTEHLLYEFDRRWMWDWFRNSYLLKLCHQERSRVFSDTGHYFYWTREVERQVRNICEEILDSRASEFSDWGVEVEADQWRAAWFDVDSFCDASRCFDTLSATDRNVLKAEYMMVPAQLRPYVEGSARTYSRRDVLQALRRLRDLMNGGK